MGHVFALNDTRGTAEVSVPFLSDDLIPPSFSYTSDHIPCQCGMCGSWVNSFIGHQCLFSVVDDPIPGRKSRSISWAGSSQLVTIRFYFAQEPPMAPPPYFPSRMPAIAYDLSDPASPSPSADAGPFYSLADDLGSDISNAANAAVLSIATSSISDPSYLNGSGGSFDLLLEKILRPYGGDAATSVARYEPVIAEEVSCDSPLPLFTISTSGARLDLHSRANTPFISVKRPGRVAPSPIIESRTLGAPSYFNVLDRSESGIALTSEFSDPAVAVIAAISVDELAYCRVLSGSHGSHPVSTLLDSGASGMGYFNRALLPKGFRIQRMLETGPCFARVADTSVKPTACHGPFLLSFYVSGRDWTIEAMEMPTLHVAINPKSECARGWLSLQYEPILAPGRSRTSYIFGASLYGRF